MKSVFFLFVVLLSNTLKGQVSAIPDRELVGFTNHLISYGSYDLAINFASSKVTNPTLALLQKDSLHFLIGLALDLQKKDSLAEKSYLQVSDSSSLYLRSHFLAAQKCINRNQFSRAHDILSGLPMTDNPETNETRLFLETGTALLSGKNIPADIEKTLGSFTIPALQKELRQISYLSSEKKRLKNRSPWVAGVLSAMVPGLGKVYAGSNAQGLATFLRVALFGGLTAENYLRHGIKNPQFWFLGGVTTVYYFGNIYGSVYLPKLNYQEKIDAIQHDSKLGLLSVY